MVSIDDDAAEFVSVSPLYQVADCRIHKSSHRMIGLWNSLDSRTGRVVINEWFLGGNGL